ncbi:uncharacterized protein LOC111642709 [Centruroides sculpturatus]|uniref:uncharacterized protein LOC111642709 n=1 Tax=Centruroides sculpturatus TaxID=218467 RepID=UPI000C6E626A|nr:uncharacterized protein LOC111642709 [Centruroides sculpturatus]
MDKGNTQNEESQQPKVNQHSLNILQTNLGRGVEAVSQLVAYPATDAKVLLLQEPYQRDGKPFGWPLHMKKLYHCGNEVPWTMIGITDPNLCCLLLTQHSNAYQTFIKINNMSQYWIIGSVYVPMESCMEAALKDIEVVIDKYYSTHRIIIGGNFNAHSFIWYEEETDDRGEAIEEFACEKDLFFLNEPGNLSTFESSNGTSNVVITICNKLALNFVNDWEVLNEITLSDHRYITFKITSFITPDSNIKKYNLRRANWDKIITTITEADYNFESINTELDAEIAANSFLHLLTTTIDRHIPLYKERERIIRWWNKDPQTHKNKTNAKRKRYQKSRNPAERELLKEAYLEEQKKYKEHIRSTKRTSWKDFCTRSSAYPWNVLEIGDLTPKTVSSYC